MPSPITVTVNFIDLTGNNISGYMTASIVSPSGVYDLFVSGLGIIAPKFSTSGIGTTVSVSVWGNDVVTDMADGLKDTYYTVNLFNTSNVLVWSAAYLFTGTAPVNLVGYPSLTVVPAPPSSFVPVLAIGGVNTNVQSNQGGALYGDNGFTYTPTGQLVGGAQGLFVSATPGTATFAVAVANVGTPGAAFYSYTVVARKGIAEISIGAGSTATGNATLTSGNYNSLSWSAVPGATSYDIYVSSFGTATGTGFIVSTISLIYHDIGTPVPQLTSGGPLFAENGFLCVSNGLLVQNSNYQTLQSHFGDATGMLSPYLASPISDGPQARNEFVTVGPGMLVDTVNMPVVGVYSSNGPNWGASVVNAINTSVGVSGSNVGAINATFTGVGITTSLGASFVGVYGTTTAQNCNLTGFASDYDHGCVIGGRFFGGTTPAQINSHVDCIIGVIGSGNINSSTGSSTSSVTHLIGVGGFTDFGQGASGSPASIINCYQFKAGGNDAGVAGTPATCTNFYNYFADVTGEQSATITNMYGFYSKNLTHPSGPVNTLQAAFYAEDQGNNTGAWAYFSAGTTPSQMGGPLKIGGIALPIVTKTANYSTLITDYMVLMNAAGATTVTLLTTGIPVGKIYTVKNINTGTVTVVGQTGNIDNAANFSIPTQYASASFQWDGSKWWIS